MKKHYIYESSGKPINGSILKNIEDLKTRVQQNNKAAVIIIDGGVGEGKTTLAVHLADEYQNAEIDLEKQYAFGGIEFAAKLEKCFNERLPVVIYDEGGDFTKRQALSGFNKNMLRLFEVFRAFGIMVIVVLPNFSVLDEHLFNLKLPRMLLNCHNRSNRSGNYRAYSLKRMMYIKEFMKKNVIKEKAYKVIQPNFRGHFLDLPKDRAEKLNKICLKGKLGIVSEGILRDQGLLNLKEISKRIGKSPQYCYQMLKKLNIEPEHKIGKTGYFPDYCIESIKGLMSR